MAKLKNTNLNALQQYILSLKPHHRATICKQIHNWTPTYSVLCPQGREPSPPCPRCRQAIETSDHVWKYPHDDAITSQQNFLTKLSQLIPKITTGSQYSIVYSYYFLVQTFLNTTFTIFPKGPYNGPTSLYTVLLIDPDDSSYKHSGLGHLPTWLYFIILVFSIQQAHSDTCPNNMISSGDHKLVHAILTLSQNIWQDKNRFLHGSTMAESQQKL